MSIVSFRIDDEKKGRLDSLAALRERDRSYIINEAIDAYLNVMAWQLSSIRKGMEQAERGEFASDDEVRAAFERWERPLS